MLTINLQDNLQKFFWTQVYGPLCPDLIYFICLIYCAHVHGRVVLWSYLKSLFTQNLSSFFSNSNRCLALTASSGSLFHISTILFVNENFLMSLRDLGFDIFRLFPLVTAVFKIITGVSFFNFEVSF